MNEIKEGVIEAYRKIISQRYNYDRIAAKYTMPQTMDRANFELIRAYFLDHIYPPIDQRRDLDKAFAQLDKFIRYPQKLLSLVKDSASIVFKYGRHLPSIISAGLKALSTFRTANKFETLLANAAEQSKLLPPYTQLQIEQFIRTLPVKAIEDFMEEGLALFDTIKDRELVKRIIQILRALIEKMENRPKIYTEEEKNALRMGLSLIEGADQLFGRLSPVEQEIIFDFVWKIEKEAIEDIMVGAS